MYIINTIPHGKCFVQYLRTRCFCIRNLTRSLRSLVRFLIRQQLVCKYHTPALSMKYSLCIFKIFFVHWALSKWHLELCAKRIYQYIYIFFFGSYHLLYMYWWYFFSHIAGKEQVFIFIQFRSFEFCIAPVRTGRSDIIIILWCTVNKSATIFMVCILL